MLDPARHKADHPASGAQGLPSWRGDVATAWPGTWTSDIRRAAPTTAQAAGLRLLSLRPARARKPIASNAQVAGSGTDGPAVGPSDSVRGPGGMESDSGGVGPSDSVRGPGGVESDSGGSIALDTISGPPKPGSLPGSLPTIGPPSAIGAIETTMMIGGVDAGIQLGLDAWPGGAPRPPTPSARTEV